MAQTTYCSVADVYSRWGTVNVQKWADLDDTMTNTTMVSRITLAIEVTAAKMEDVVRGTRYSIPMVGMDGTTPYTIRFLNATLAGVWLYEGKGIQDYEPNTGKAVHRYQFAKDDAESQLKGLVTSTLDIDMK